MNEEIKRPNKTGGISQAVAEEEFERFCKAARLKMDRVRDQLSQKDIKADKQYFIEELMEGRITVDSDGWPTVHTENEALPEIVFNKRPTGKSLMAMDKKKSGQDAAKMFAIVGAYLGINPPRLMDLDDVDWVNVECVYSLFRGNRA